MRDDYESLIKTRPVGRWAETAAILLTYVPQPDFKRLCTKLAKRLDESGMVCSFLLPPCLWLLCDVGAGYVHLAAAAVDVLVLPRKGS